MANPKSFHYLNQSNCFELEGVDDAEEYIALRRAMDVVGISDQEQVGHCFISSDVMVLYFVYFF